MPRTRGPRIREPIQFAKVLRKKMTLPEVLLRMRLKGTEFHFRRQHPFPPYTLDFFSEKVKLCIEVDGENHESHGRDGVRDGALSRAGIVTYRIAAAEILKDPDSVATAALGYARERLLE